MEGEYILCNFQKTFKPTEEQRKEAFDNLQKFIKKSYDEKWCCTCINYIPIDEDFPPCVTAYPECKLGGLATDSCKNYVSNKEE